MHPKPYALRHIAEQGCSNEGDRLTNVQINHGWCPVGPDSIVQQQSAECTFANISGPNNLHIMYSVLAHQLLLLLAESEQICSSPRFLALHLSPRSLLLYGSC